jgi:hypothetical protein
MISIDSIMITLLSVVVGLIIVSIVDRRLSDISINMPVVKLPEITVNISEEANGSRVARVCTVKSGTTVPLVKSVKPSTGKTGSNTDQIGGNTGNTVTYYLDPKDMSPHQLQVFRTKAKQGNMTPKDYQNWLSVQ